MHVPALDRLRRRGFAGVAPRLQKFGTENAQSEKKRHFLAPGLSDSPCGGGSGKTQHLAVSRSGASSLRAEPLVV
jgi:hypothetical protein